MINVTEDRANRITFISIDDATPRVRTGLTAALRTIGKENKKYCKGLIRSLKKTGNIHTIGGRRHQASAPGEPPASQTGALAASIGYRSSGWNYMEFGDKVPYGKFLEGGTRKMEPRPHLTTTAEDKSRDNYNEIVQQTGLELNKK